MTFATCRGCATRRPGLTAIEAGRSVAFTMPTVMQDFTTADLTLRSQRGK